MIYNKIIITLVFTLFFGCAFAQGPGTMEMQIGLNSTNNDNNLELIYTPLETYVSPWNRWNAQNIVLKWPSSGGQDLLTNGNVVISNNTLFTFQTQGTAEELGGFFYQRFEANVSDQTIDFTQNVPVVVTEITLVDNGVDPEFEISIVDAADIYVTGGTNTNGAPGLLNLAGNQFSAFTNQSETILPITLTRFTATKDEKSVNLDWSTSSEINGSHFDVQRSRDLDSWTTIGTVDAVGESSTVQEYQLIDKDLPLSTRSSKTFYYRLNMVDNDGTSELSEIRTVRFDQDGADFIVYPNPTINEVFVNLSSITTETGPATMNVINMKGERVKKVTLSTNDDVSVDVSNMTAGLYYFIVKQGQDTFSQKVIVID